MTANAGDSFLDRMIRLVEGAKRQKAPNEIALTVLLSILTLIFLIVVAAIAPVAVYLKARINIADLVALLVALIPTTIGALLSAIGIAAIDRTMRFNVLATSGRAVEAVGDVQTLILDKTGTHRRRSAGHRVHSGRRPNAKGPGPSGVRCVLFRHDAGRQICRRRQRCARSRDSLRPRLGHRSRFLRRDSHERRRFS